jgi:hypothetical protein
MHSWPGDEHDAYYIYIYIELKSNGELKSNDRDYILKWSILKRAGAYSSGAKRCNLCIEEKLGYY